MPGRETDDVGKARKPLFSYLCPYADCQERNFVFREDANLCFNCHRELWLGAAAREARWYEEAGRNLRGDGETMAFLGFCLCVVVLLGAPMLISGILEARRGRAAQERGEEMNRIAGRPKLARSTRHFGGLSGGEYRVKRGPDPEDTPPDPGIEEPRWLRPFRRTYYAIWAVAIAAAILVVAVTVHSPVDSA